MTRLIEAGVHDDSVDRNADDLAEHFDVFLHMIQKQYSISLCSHQKPSNPYSIPSTILTVGYWIPTHYCTYPRFHFIVRYTLDEERHNEGVFFFFLL